jgi:hypothetical protein
MLVGSVAHHETGAPDLESTPDEPTSSTVLAYLTRVAPSLRWTASVSRRPSAGRHRQGPDPLEHRPEQAAGQVTLRQQ